MRYRIFGPSGLRVSEVCLGTMTFGTERGVGADKAESRAMFDTFVTAGGNFFDTANTYTNGTSERMLGEFLGAERHRYVVATKYSGTTRPDDPNGGGNHRKSLVQAIEGSLARLRIDYVDILWMHLWDGLTPIEEVVRALDDLVRSGKVLHVGVSDTPGWLVSRAVTLAQLRGWSAFVGLQIEYSLIERTPERELLPMANGLGLGVTAWSPLGGGILTGKYNRGDAATEQPRRLDTFTWMQVPDERNLAVAAEVSRIAEEVGCPASHIALVWLARKQPNVIPILGARSAAQLGQNLAVAQLTLSDEHFNRLDVISAVPLGFPHDFLAGPTGRSMIYGSSQRLFDVDA